MGAHLTLHNTLHGRIGTELQRGRRVTRREHPTIIRWLAGVWSSKSKPKEGTTSPPIFYHHSTTPSVAHPFSEAGSFPSSSHLLARLLLFDCNGVDGTEQWPLSSMYLPYFAGLKAVAEDYVVVIPRKRGAFVQML